MKNLILSLITLTALSTGISSCGGNKETQTEKTTTETTVTESAKPAPEVMNNSDAPHFSSEEVNKNLAMFGPLKEEYIKALESRDVSKISVFVRKYTDWVKTSALWGSKLKPDEQQAFSDYLTLKSKEWAEATQKTMQH